jgi:hypothetical protein
VVQHHAVQELVRTHHLRADTIVTMMLAQQAVLRTLEMPFQDSRRLRSILTYALEDHMPFAPEDVMDAGHTPLHPTTSGASTAPVGHLSRLHLYTQGRDILPDSRDTASKGMKRMWSNGAQLNRCLWLASLLLVLLIAILGVAMVQSYRRMTHPIPGAFVPPPPTSLPETLPPAVLADYQSIAARNLFNATPSQPPAPQPSSPPVAQPPQTLPLPLQLVGSVTNPQGQQYAITADLTKQGAQAMYQIGDRIQQAWLVDIQPRCVLLDRGGQKEALCFSKNELVEKIKQRRPVLQSASPRASDDSHASPLQVDAR